MWLINPIFMIIYHFQIDEKGCDLGVHKDSVFICILNEKKRKI